MANNTSGADRKTTFLTRIEQRRVEDWVVANKTELSTGKYGTRDKVADKARIMLNIPALTVNHVARAAQTMEVKIKRGESVTRKNRGGGCATQPSRMAVVASILTSLTSEVLRLNREYGLEDNNHTSKLKTLIERGCDKFIEAQYQQLRRDMLVLEQAQQQQQAVKS
jgi:hypothetical protein